MSDNYHYPMDRFRNSREGREYLVVQADYGQDMFNDDLVQPVGLPGMGNAYYVKYPVHLVKIAANLSRFSELQPVDVFRWQMAVGWTTGLTTVLTTLTDLRDDFLRYPPGEQQRDASGRPVRRPVPELLERSNVIASREFREQFCHDWPGMARQFPFITQDGVC